MQKIYQGRTNNHINWVMVDATDFATPESALSAATTIKVYGQLRSATGTNFVSSGTGSLTNDITHVGASATGQYHIALAKADISDASAAFYDVYVITLSATGAAYQTLICDGVKDDGSYVSNVLSYMSDVLSNVNSMLVAGTFAVGASNASDVASAVWAHTFGARVDSRLLLVQSRLSDFDSRLVSDISDVLSAVRGNSDALSDILSRINSASFLSDIASHVWAAKYTANSAASSFGSLMSDIYSRAGGAVTASDISDIASAVWATALATKLVTLNSSDMSDLRSAITAGPAATITASDISDIASAVWAAKYTAHSAASSFGSLFSDVYSRVVLIQSAASDAASAAAQANSRALVVQSMASDAHSAAAQANSRALVVQSSVSDIYSLLSDVSSDITVMSGVLSDVYSGVVALSGAVSDVDSAINSQYSDVKSAIGTVPDSMLNRNIAGGGSGNTRNVRNALRAVRNRATISGTTLRVYQENDLTTAWSAVTSTAAGNPIVSVDPS